MRQDLQSRDRVRHPGPEAPARRTFARVGAVPVSFQIPAGVGLSESIANAMDRLGAESAVLILDGLRIRHCEYVMPAESKDDTHAAWYSDVHFANDIVLDSATAVVGRKEGAWFLHSHALWGRSEAAPAMGHLMCAQVLPAAPFVVHGYTLEGATLDVKHDPETNFSLFHISGTDAGVGNALLLTIRPHEDFRDTLDQVAREAGIPNARIIGIGSVIGAQFEAGGDMHASLSEIVVLPDSVIEGGRCKHLRIACVDPDGTVYSGDLKSGAGPVCVTAEILLVSTPPL